MDPDSGHTVPTTWPSFHTAEYMTFKYRLSNFVAFLPSSIQSRLPLRSLRQRIGIYGTLKRRHALSGWLDRRPMSMFDYVADDDNNAELMEGIYNERRGSSAPSSRPTTPFSGASTLVRLAAGAASASEPPKQPGNIDHRFQALGMSLLRVSEEEGRRSRNPASDASLERQAFLDGIVYLHRAIPENLDPVELDRLRNSLPQSLRHAEIAEPSASESKIHLAGQPVLYRCVRSIVIQLILFINFVLPYLVLLGQLALQTERRYRVVESIAGQGMVVAGAIGRRGVYFTSSMAAVPEGQLAQAFTDAATRTFQSIASGLSDGVGDGLAVVAGRRRE